MFAGGVFSWLVMIPVIVLFGQQLVLYPGTEPIGEMYATGGASVIWSSYIRYIGAGALAAGGIISLIKSLPLIVRTFGDALKSMKGASKGEVTRTSKDISMSVVITSIAVITILIWCCLCAGCGTDSSCW